MATDTLPSSPPRPPGSAGLPGLGETLAFVKDPFTFIKERRARYGRVFRTNLLGRMTAVLIGSEPLEAFYDPANVTREGANPANMQTLFGGTGVINGLDGAAHRARKGVHRAPDPGERSRGARAARRRDGGVTGRADGHRSRREHGSDTGRQRDSPAHADRAGRHRQGAPRVRRRRLRDSGGLGVAAAVWHHDREANTFAEPERFDPDRFGTRAEHHAHPYAYAPQGAGPPDGHRCPGFDLTTMFMALFAARLVRGYTWVLPQQDLTPNWGLVPPVPRDGLRAVIEARHAGEPVAST